MRLTCRAPQNRSRTRRQAHSGNTNGRHALARLSAAVLSQPTRMRPVHRLFIAIACMVEAASAHPIPAPKILPTPAPHIQFGGGDGTDCAHAVIIVGASHETEGVRAERWWVYSKHQGARIASQSVVETDGRALETITIITADGEPRAICFDITSFFGIP